MRHMEILQKEPSSAPDFGKFESYTAGVIFPTMLLFFFQSWLKPDNTKGECQYF